MLRILTAVAMLFAVTPMLSADAFAKTYTKDELKMEKDEVKFAKGQSKDVAKLAKKWHKNADKEKDNSDIEAELREYYKAELANLRDKGVPTKVAEPIPEHPQHKDKVLPIEDEDRPKLESLRDTLVKLKDNDTKDKKYGKLLDEYSALLDSRYERKDERYKEHKKMKA